jgi:hypothetical protein
LEQVPWHAFESLKEDTRIVDDCLLALLEEYATHLAPILDQEGSAPAHSSPWT